jgi:hypothetical protein
MDALDGITAFWCVHWNTTPAVDGTKICLRCGAAIEEPDIRRDLQRAAEIIRRAPHSMRCVESDGEWFCADDCRR